MNVEIIIWGVAFFVCWELVYIYLLKNSSKNEIKNDWLETKFNSFGFVSIFFIIQFLIIGFDSSGNFASSLYYNRLIYEVVIIAVVYLFFKINKWIAHKLK